MLELAKIAFADMAHYARFDGAAAYTNFSAMPPGATAAISEIVFDEYIDGRGDGARDVKRTKVKLYPKLPALEALIKHLDQSEFADRLRAIEENMRLTCDR